MYYPDEVVDQVRTANDIVDVIGQSVQLKKSGRDYIGLCPFHNEKTPSFSVSRIKQMFYCFGCHKGGNVITFVEEYDHLSFTEAVEALAGRAGIRLPEQEYSPQERRSRDEKEALLNVNRIAGAYYYYMLRTPEGKSGMDYLTGRRLTDETMKNFGLGYAGKHSDALYRYLKQKGISDDLLRQSGLMNVDERRGTMYDKFWNRVIFPIMDVNNRVIGFGGRLMGDGRPKYLNSPETKIFDKSRNLYALNAARRSRSGQLILSEGYMDVISMHQAGFTNAVASLGTALTQQHCALMKRYTDSVILSYDSDNAGVSAAMRAIPMLRSAGITPRVLNLEPYKDPDEFIKAMGKEAFQERLDKAENAFLFEVRISQRDYNLQDPDSRTQFFREVAGRIAAFELEMERQNYIDAVAREYMIDPRQLKELVLKALVLGGTSAGRTGTAYGGGTGSVPLQGIPAERASVPGSRSGSAREQGETAARKLLINYLVQYPGIYETVRRYLSADDYGDGVAGKTAALVYSQLDASGEVDAAAVLSRFEDLEDQQEAAQILHTTESTASAAESRKAILETLRRVYQAAPLRAGEGQDALSAAIQKKKNLESIRKINLILE